MTKPRVTITVVNHVGIDIATIPDKVWAHIVSNFVEAASFRATGFVIEPSTDPGAVLGGYRMSLERDGAVVDERVVRFSERDDAGRRLSLFADFLSQQDGMLVHATYHAAATASGARYTIDCHTQMGIREPATDTRASVAATASEMKASFDKHLCDYLARTRDSLEQAEGRDE